MNSINLFREIARFVRTMCPGDKCEVVYLKLSRGTIKLQPPLMGLSDVEIPIPGPVVSGGVGASGAGAVGTVEPEFTPIPRKFHPIQAAILKALAGGKSLKGEALIDASKIGGKGDLFRRGHGINELREMGLAGHEGGVGYFLTERGEEVVAGLE